MEDIFIVEEGFKNVEFVLVVFEVFVESSDELLVVFEFEVEEFYFFLFVEFVEGFGRVVDEVENVVEVFVEKIVNVVEVVVGIGRDGVYI